MSVEELQARIKKISADIERQKKLLKYLEQNKSLVQRQLNAARDPMARLPLEISSEIFIQCLPSFPEPGAHRLPMILLNVCNTWTDIALSTPALWEAIRVVYPRAEGFPQLLTIWLQRACNRPLSVSFTDAFHEGVIPIIWQHNQRLKHLEICYKQEYGNEDSDEESPHRKEIDISECTSLGPFPLLETLSIRHSSRVDDAPTYDGSQIIEILRLAPNLVECVLDRIYPGWDAIDDLQEQVVLPTLRRLMFGKEEFNYSDGSILKHLSIPRLEALTLSMRAISFADLSSFLKRSAPPLQKLVLGGAFDPTEPVDQLVECLGLVPALTHFDLGWWPKPRAEEMFAALAESPSHLLSNLRSLIIGLHLGHAPRPLFWKTFLRALSVRRTQIRVVHVTTLESWKPTADILAAFKELTVGGMDIFVGRGRTEQNLLSP
ncbi:hypothetical protein B0H11DRAFT_1146860 [Mycena galericulata]|nr:hypothetical protein B0H11DRAFT_1146860 [Mycena galericulata]